MAARGEFSSRWGFLLAAAGSAIGLGNIWGFPTQTASHGGAAFLLVYLVLAFLLACPALIAELLIGRHARANAIAAMGGLSDRPVLHELGAFSGLCGIVTASLILAFYSIVAGWMVAYALAPAAELVGMSDLAQSLTAFGLMRNLLFLVVFMLLTVMIVGGGIQGGIERWSRRLMPTLLGLMVLLVIYVLMQDGASEGLKAYLVPDFSEALNPNLIVSALGQAFFSLSLGVGTMMIYGSYVSREENIPKLAASVTLLDTGVAVLAGLLILPAMYVAQHLGVAIFDEAGQLIAEDQLIFNVLPALFAKMGDVGELVGMVFFVLMTVAALTSSISMLEVPVAYVTERFGWTRHHAAWTMGGLATLIGAVICFNFGALFGAVVTLTTGYSQPLLGVMICLFAGWVWHRDSLLNEIRQGFPMVELTWFWRIWPFYVRVICPLAILLIFVQSLRG